ncbi:hypothetical protein [Streptomyces sp. CB02130]|nr:hypothetical protein [Streptomyces sp. CB02130]
MNLPQSAALLDLLRQRILLWIVVHHAGSSDENGRLGVEGCQLPL